MRDDRRGPGQRLRERLDRGGTVVAPGVSDGVAAALAAEAGFEAIYVSGAGAAAARGWPDMSVMTLGELVDATRVVTTRSGLPAIVDLDTGYGGPLSLRRALLELEQAGAGAVHLEDQEFPRRCGYLTVEPCISIVEMEHRLASARAVETDLLLIARTDSLLTDGVEDAAIRAAAYHEAGADLVFVNGIRTLDELAQIYETVGAPMLYNVSGSDRSPRLSPSKAADYGVRLIIYPIQADRAAAVATQRFLTALAADDVDSLPELLGFERFMDLAGWSEAQSFEDSLPDLPA